MKGLIFERTKCLYLTIQKVQTHFLYTFFSLYNLQATACSLLPTYRRMRASYTIIIIVFIRVNYINHILQRTYTHNIYLQTHTHIYIYIYIYIDPKRVRYKRDSKNHARYPSN